MDQVNLRSTKVLIPTLMPTIFEFTHLCSYIYSNETLIAPYGACKIIPPREWTKIKGLSLSSVKSTAVVSRQSIIKLSPLVSRVTSSPRKINSQREAIQLKTFVDYAHRPQNRISYEVTDIECAFWTMIESNIITKRVIHHATNTDFSLFPRAETTFNLNNIPLKSLLSLTTQRIIGITSPFLHIGMFGSTFALRTEESDLFSMNYMHEGSPKFWYFISASYANRLEQCLQNADVLDASDCEAPLRHKTLFLNPDELFQTHNIPVYRVEQCPNDIIVIFPRVYHWGFDGGFNVAESVNFALPSWISFGQQARSCTCHRQNDSVKIDMNPFNELNVQNYIRTHLNVFYFDLDSILLTPSVEQSVVIDSEQTSLNIETPIPTAMLTSLFSEEFDTSVSNSLSNTSSPSHSSVTLPLLCVSHNEQLSPALLRTSTTVSKELRRNSFATQGNDNTAGKVDETAAKTAFIRRKWAEENDVLLTQLIADVNKPKMSNIHQWKMLLYSDDVDLNDYLPENMQNYVHLEKKTIKSFADWTVAFTSFRRAVLYLFEHRGSELDAHFIHISNLYTEESYEIELILCYEADIRHHVAIMPHLSLFTDFSSLLKRHFIMSKSRMPVEETGEQKEICLNYNSRYRRCRLKKCPRLHICSNCFGLMEVQRRHSAASCRTTSKKHSQKALTRVQFSPCHLSTSSCRHVLSNNPY